MAAVTRKPKPEAVLDRRALNRALLARQWLLEAPRPATALAAIEHLVGLQAQDVKAPYLQLRARLAGFDPTELSELLASRAAVRIVLMRGTLHLVSARDALRLRPLVQPVVTRATEANWAVAADRDALAAAGRALVEEQPRTFAQLGALLAERWPGDDPRALAQQVRALVPLVQVPPRGLWGRSGAPAHTSLEAWLGRPLEPPSDEALDAIVRRYLGAFGPATVADLQKWSGLTGLRPAFERLRGELVAFTDAETGRRELLDLPAAPRPPAETPAPPRLVGPFDNLVLSHADATRVLPAEHRPRVMTQNGLLSGLVLVDGFVAGGWRIEVGAGRATVEVTRFTAKAYAKREVGAIEEEGERVLRFAAPHAGTREVRFVAPG